MVLTQVPVKPAPYRSTGQGRDRRRRTRGPSARRVRLWRLEILAGSLVLVAVTSALTAWPAPAPGRTMPPGITLIRSGVLVADPFSQATANRELEDSYAFNGSAAPGVGWVRATGGGLDVGVRPHRGWAGWFAVTVHAAGAASVWHAEVSRPSGTPTHGLGEAVLAVQSASTERNSSLNYVVVAALSGGGPNRWQVGSAHGFTADAVTDVLWRVGSSDQPASYPVTVRTDGRRRLRVWLGDRLVYDSTTLDMHDPAPFQTYLEVQAKDTPYVARFRNFWVADAAPVTVMGIAPFARVELTFGHSVVSATADRNGRASLEVPPPEEVGTGTLTVRARSVVRRFPGLRYAGGDVLDVGPR